MGRKKQEGVKQAGERPTGVTGLLGQAHRQGLQMVVLQLQHLQSDKGLHL